MRQKRLRLFALLLQEQPLQCKEKAAYLKNYRQESWERGDSLANRGFLPPDDWAVESAILGGRYLSSTTRGDRIRYRLVFVKQPAEPRLNLAYRQLLSLSSIHFLFYCWAGSSGRSVA